MVLDAGRVVEFASPGHLLRKTDSIFYGMAKEAGLAPKIDVIQVRNYWAFIIPICN